MVSARSKIVLAAGITLAAAIASVACNAVLGIDVATQGPIGGDSGVSPGTDSGSTDAGTGADSADAALDPNSCPGYCHTITAACAGPKAEYLTEDVCNVMCPKFDLGQPGDTSGNSRACRITYANMAATDDTKCRAAGPLGFPSCSNAPCEPWCTLDIALCEGVAFDGGEVGCVQACEDPDAGFVLMEDAGDVALSGGNTLNCRVYHLESAYDPDTVGAKTTHCPHTAVVSATCH